MGLSGGTSFAACAWDLAGDAAALDPRTDARSLALGADEDGDVVVGRADSRAFRWTLEGGLEALPGVGDEDISVEAKAVAADGSVVVGTAVLGSWDVEAFVWREGIGTRSLKAMLAEEHGLALPGWTLWGLSAVSSDRLSMVGYGNCGVRLMPFVVHLVCPADYNFDREIDALDALAFLEEFGACLGATEPCGTAGAPDVNADGEVDVLDLLAFFEAYAARCE